MMDDPVAGVTARRDRVAAAVVAASAAMDSEAAVSQELRRFIVRLHEWMAGPESTAFYRTLTDDEQQRFDRLLVRSSILRMRLSDMDVAQLAMRVSMQTGLLRGAIGDARKHLEQPLHAGTSLAAFDRFLETITNFLL